MLGVTGKKIGFQSLRNFLQEFGVNMGFAQLPAEITPVAIYLTRKPRHCALLVFKFCCNYFSNMKYFHCGTKKALNY